MPICFMVSASFITPLLPDSQLTYPSGYWTYGGLHQIRLGLLHPLDYTLQLDYLYRWAYDWNYVA